MCSGDKGGSHFPFTDLPSQTAPQPISDASVVITNLLWRILPSGVPLQRKLFSLQGSKACMQACDTNSFFIWLSFGQRWKELNHRIGCTLSRPKGITTEAATIIPQNFCTLWAVTTFLFWKWFIPFYRLSTLWGVRHASIVMEMKCRPRNSTCSLGWRLFFFFFSVHCEPQELNMS